MARTIHELIEARAAKEPLTESEVDRLTQHERQRLVALVDLAAAPPSEWEQFVERGDEFETLRQDILRYLDAKDVDEHPLQRIAHLEEVFRGLLVSLGAAHDLVAKLKGTKRRQRKQSGAAAQQSALARRNKAREFLKTIEALKAEEPAVTSDRDAVKRWLRKTDPDWWSASLAFQKNRKVETVLHRIREARKTVDGA